MSETINFEEAYFKKRLGDIKQRTEDGGDDKADIIEKYTGFKGKDIKDACDTMEYKLAKCEELFYQFVSKSIDEEDTFIWMSFLIHHIRALIVALEEDDNNKDAFVTIDFLGDWEEKFAKEYIRKLLGVSDY